MQKRIVVILILGVLAVATIAYFVFFTKNNEVVKKDQILGKCLDENIDVSYKIEEEKTPLADVIVYIADKNARKEISSFRINDIFKTSTSIESHRCGIYVIRMFNYDPKKTKQDPGYKDEFWKYSYDGNGEPLILFAEKPKEFIAYFSLDFRVDPTESYIVLEKGYLGKDDYSLVIKDLKTKEDVFVLFAKTIFNQYPNIVGNFNMREWTKDGKYFWGDIFDGAYVLAYLRIDTQNWKYDIYEAPDGTGGGSPLNINTGYVPIQPGQIWTGDYQLTQELKEQYRKEGKKSELYLYNLFTNEKIFVEINDEPLFWFKPSWLSDTELQYELPTGEKKIYTIQ